MNNAAQDEFWQELVEIEQGIVTCPECRRNSGDDDCSPQVSWAGAQYKPGGVVFLLQNPGSRGFEGIDRLRDQRVRPRLQAFRDSPTVENYRLLVSEMHSQMQGDPWPSWSSWSHPVSKCIQDCLTIEHVVWASVVKHRKPGREATIRLPAAVQQEHGIQAHLKGELEVLRPSVVVAVGLPAARAMTGLEGLWRVVRVKSKAASLYDAYKARDQIRALGLCRRRAF